MNGVRKGTNRRELRQPEGSDSWRKAGIGFACISAFVAIFGDVISTKAAGSPVVGHDNSKKLDRDSWPWNLLDDEDFLPEDDFKQLDFKLSPSAETIEQFDPTKINYTAVRLEIDEVLRGLNQRRDGKSLDLGSVTQLPKFLSTTLKYVDLKQVIYEVENSLLSSVSCTACKTGVGLLQHYIKTGKTRQEIAHAAIKLCINLKLESKRVCVGIIYLFVDEVLYILERLMLQPEELCGVIIGDACAVPYIPWHDWNVTFPPIPKPADAAKAPPAITSMLAAGTKGGPLKVLHLSDNHYDPHYLAGSNAECGEPLCCRATDGLPAQPSAAAGLWGDYRKCDTPKRTIEHLYEHIVKTHPDLDYIIWTGDLPPHDVWNQTRDDQLHVLKETVAQLVRYFPDTPIFPALGNHESTPVNSFPPPYVQQAEFSIQWLYDELDNQWRRWLPEATSQTVRYGAYYSVAVRPGFRVISLNMNYCHNKNWWLLLNTTDPAQELQWLVYELQAAELSGDLVHILGHIPPGHADCLKTWSKNFYKVINRYEKTVAAQFYGHTHFDEFSLFYDETVPTRAVSIAYIGPSVTPYYDLNPGYRVYTIDGDREGTTRQVLDHENWYMDLKEANLYNRPKWRKLYSALQAYGMKGSTPKDWDTLVHKLTYNDNLFQTYFKFYWKASPVRPQCDEECKKRLLCDLVSGRSHDRKQTCVVIEQRMDEQTGGWKTWLVNGLTITFLLFGLYLAVQLIAYLRSSRLKQSSRQMNVLANMDAAKWRRGSRDGRGEGSRFAVLAAWLPDPKCFWLTCDDKSAKRFLTNADYEWDCDFDGWEERRGNIVEKR